MTAKVYGKIKSQLKMKGKPIPENDIWIASLAQQHKGISKNSLYPSLLPACTKPFRQRQGEG